jgi:hypothetical protein
LKPSRPYSSQLYANFAGTMKILLRISGAA